MFYSEFLITYFSRNISGWLFLNQQQKHLNSAQGHCLILFLLTLSKARLYPKFNVVIPWNMTVLTEIISLQIFKKTSWFWGYCWGPLLMCFHQSQAIRSLFCWSEFMFLYLEYSCHLEWYSTNVFERRTGMEIERFICWS